MMIPEAISLMKKNNQQQQQQRAMLTLWCISIWTRERLGSCGCQIRMVISLIIIEVVANHSKNRSQLQEEEIISNKDKNIYRCSNRSNPKGDSISSKNNYALLDDDFVISEILVRLPVKTLMRFKSVHKSWLSSIQHDPHFHQLHFNHSPLGLYMIKEKHDTSVHSECFVSIKGDSNESHISAPAVATFHTFRERDELYYEEYLDPVNGLTCFAYLRSICIYNPSTREETQWIRTPLDSANFSFGFDTVSKKHKVVVHGGLGSDSYLPFGKYVCEVLTMGVDKSWRRIDDHHVLHYDLFLEQSYYVNGAIYWMLKKETDKFGNDVPTVLLTFDLGTEKFREIPIPDFVIDLPSKCHSVWAIDLLELDGRVALLPRIRNKNLATMWRLTYDDEDDHNRNCWTQVLIALPFYWEEIKPETYVRFGTIPGSTCQIMVTVIKYDIDGRELSVYICNWKTNALTKIEFGEFSSSPKLYYYRPLPLTESLFPVNYH